MCDVTRRCVAWRDVTPDMVAHGSGALLLLTASRTRDDVTRRGPRLVTLSGGCIAD